MKITMEHKLNEEQKAELSRELDAAIEDLQEKMETVFEGWEQTKKIFTYTLVVTGVVCFGTGFVLGRSV